MVSSSLKNLKELTENPFLILRCLGDVGTCDSSLVGVQEGPS